jgi:hypothetical protein
VDGGGEDAGVDGGDRAAHQGDALPGAPIPRGMTGDGRRYRRSDTTCAGGCVDGAASAQGDYPGRVGGLDGGQGWRGRCSA